MNLLVPRPARMAALGLAFTLSVTSLGCRPDNDVEPGPPVIKKMIIAQMGPFGPFGTSILPTTTDCAPTVMEGGSCTPSPEALCRQASANTWCDCVANDTGGTWACPAIANVFSVIAVFDRLLDTAPFTDEDGMPTAIDDGAAASAGGMAVDVLADYASNGNEPGLIFPIYGPFFGNLRQEGPTVGVSPAAGAFPSASTITVSLRREAVRAKDMQSGFVGDGLLQDGVVTFTTAPFAVALAAPDPMVDPDAVQALFTNFIDPDAVGPLVTATANGTPVEITTSSSTGADLVIEPAMPPWPPGATIVVTIDATAGDVLGQMLGAPQSVTFTAP